MFKCRPTFEGIEGRGLYTYVGIIYIAVIALNFVVASRIKGCDPPDGSDAAHPLEQQQLGSWAAAILNLLTLLLSALYYGEVRERFPMFGYLNKIVFIACGALGFLFTATTYGYSLGNFASSCSTIENPEELRVESVWAVYLNLAALGLAHMGKKSEYMPVESAFDEDVKPAVGQKIDISDGKPKSNYAMNPDLRF